MARSRNIKPGFFANDELAEHEAIDRLLFIGLWTIADFKGDLLNRPKKIKAQILPYDNCDVEKIVINLCKSGFIAIYNVSDVSYIHINNFEKHQNPHPNEKKKGSEIPVYKKEHAQVIDYKQVTINHDKSRQVSCEQVSNNADSCFLIPDSLIPDSCFLIPDSSIPSKNTVELKRDEALEVFKNWQELMNHPRAAFDEKRKRLIKKWLKHYSVEELKKAAFGCSLTPHNMGQNKNGERYDAIDLIYRDAEHIDRFIKNADKPPGGDVKTIKSSLDDSSAAAERIREHLKNSKNKEDNDDDE